MSQKEIFAEVFKKTLNQYVEDGMPKNEAIAAAMKHATKIISKSSAESEKKDGEAAANDNSNLNSLTNNVSSCNGTVGNVNGIESSGNTLSNTPNNGGGDIETDIEVETTPNTSANSSDNVKVAPSPTGQDESCSSSGEIEVIEIVNSKRIADLLDEAEKHDSYSNIIKLCGQFFSSSKSLSASFPLPHDQHDTSHEGILIDIDEVAKVYKLLLSRNVAGINNSITYGLESLSFSLQFHAENLKTIDSLKQFLIFFEHPQLLDPDLHHIMKNILKSITKCPENSQRLLSEWIGVHAGQKRVKYYIDILRQYITLKLLNMEVEDAKDAGRVLNLIFVQYEPHFSGKGSLISLKDFYSDTLNEEFLQTRSGRKAEYKLWLLDSQKGMLLLKQKALELEKRRLGLLQAEQQKNLELQRKQKEMFSEQSRSLNELQAQLTQLEGTVESSRETASPEELQELLLLQARLRTMDAYLTRQREALDNGQSVRLGSNDSEPTSSSSNSAVVAPSEAVVFSSNTNASSSSTEGSDHSTETPEDGRGHDSNSQSAVGSNETITVSAAVPVEQNEADPEASVDSDSHANESSSSMEALASEASGLAQAMRNRDFEVAVVANTSPNFRNAINQVISMAGEVEGEEQSAATGSDPATAAVAEDTSSATSVSVTAALDDVSAPTGTDVASTQSPAPLPSSAPALPTDNVILDPSSMVLWEKLPFVRRESFLSYAFLLTPATKAEILEIDVSVEVQQGFQSDIVEARLAGETYIIPYFVLRVRRNSIVMDTLDGILALTMETTYSTPSALVEKKLSRKFKRPLKIVFDGEEGVDAGGVRKEYYQLLTKQLLDPSFGMFIYHEDSRLLWFNSHGFENEQEYELIGLMIGIAIYNSIILDFNVPMALYKKLKSRNVDFDDFMSLQPTVGKSLQQILDYDGEEPLEDVFFGLHFDITTEVFGSPLTVELKHGGSDIPVTKENRQEYVDLYVQYVLVDSVRPQFEAFKRGFYRVCNNQAMDLFQYEELELLVCGNPKLDMKSLKEGARYDDGYDAESAVIQYFWEVVFDFNEEEKKLFLKFISGSDRSPIDGLAGMKFVISKSGVASDPDIDTRLPSAHTCFNHMLLPPYSSVDALRIKLKYAIHHSEGFGLQ